MFLSVNYFVCTVIIDVRCEPTWPFIKKPEMSAYTNWVSNTVTKEVHFTLENETIPTLLIFKCLVWKNTDSMWICEKNYWCGKITCEK